MSGFNEREVEKALSGVTDFEQMRQILHNEASRQNVTLAHSWEENPLKVQTARFSRDSDSYSSAPARDPVTGQFVSQQAEPREFSKTIQIAGKNITVTAEDALSLEKRVHEAYQVASTFQSHESETYVPELPAAERAQLNEFQRVNLELSWKNGTISTQEYLERSGAIHQYLEDQGIPVQELRQTVQENEVNRFTQSWASAAEEFKNRFPDWPGGEKNKEMLGLTVESLGLIDAQDKVAALAQAYSVMRQKSMVFDPELDEATRQAEIARQALKKIENASPTDIMQAYHEASGHNQVANADDEFVRSLSRTNSGIFGR